MILVGIFRRGGPSDFERLIDLSTVGIKLAQLLWVIVALARVGICSCDLFDLKRIHSEVGIHRVYEV